MNTGRRIVIGLTGPFGAGCTTIANDLHDYRKFRKYSLSEAMRELASEFVDDLDKEKLHSPEHRWYQQYVGNQIRGKKLYAIPERVWNKIQDDEEGNKALEDIDIVIDGIRNPSEMNYFRDKYPCFFVMAVFAPKDVRWERKRTIYGDRLGDFERDDAQDSGEIEPSTGQRVQLCVDRSDILLGNERPFDEPRVKEELRQTISDYIDLMKNPGQRGPFPSELNMGRAYQASLMSSCYKRKVGAVIVREESQEDRTRSYVISSGYNEAPINILSCVQRGGKDRQEYCYKDEKIKEVLKNEYEHCPKCGVELKFPEYFELPVICTKCNARLGKEFIPGKMLDLCIAVHAEEAAILQASRLGGTQIEGSTLYTTTFPCPLCTKMIIEVGVKIVYFAEPYPEDEALNIFAEANMLPKLFEGVKGRAYHRLFEPPPV